MKIGRFEVLDTIGEGAMGTVYRARDPLIERTVAIKAVATAELRKEGAEAEARFLREAQSAGRLSHPNIVTIYDVGETEDLAYIAMEYLPGATLREVMDKGPMPFELVLETAIQMTEALAFAHDHGVIHRDIKPANVIVSGPHGRIKLTDFGIAHLSNGKPSRAGVMLGSPRYMSPEQAMGREVSGSSDIFSLGAVLYEMVTGECAFGGDSLPAILYRVINEMPVTPQSRGSALPDAFVELLMRMLQKDPDARPAPRPLLADLKQIAAPLPAAEVPPAAGRTPAALAAIAFGTPALVMVLIAVGIIVISYFVDDTAREPSSSPPAAVAKPSSIDAPKGAGPTAAERARTEPATSGRKANAARRPAPQPDAFLQGLEQKETELQLQRTELLLRFTEQHPDVVLIDRQLEQLDAERRDYLRQRRR